MSATSHLRPLLSLYITSKVYLFQMSFSVHFHGLDEIASTLCLVSKGAELSLLQPETEQGQKLFPPTPHRNPHSYRQHMTSVRAPCKDSPKPLH